MVINTPFGTLSQEFDKLFNTTVATPAIHAIPGNYPPLNIIKIDNDEFVMEFAVAGFTKEDIEITTHKGELTVSGEKKDKELSEGAVYIQKGIAARKFVRKFTLPEYTEVLSAKAEDGILTINLVRSIPEEQKPKTVTIK